MNISSNIRLDIQSLSAVLIYNPHLIVNIAVRDSKSRKIV